MKKSEIKKELELRNVAKIIGTTEHDGELVAFVTCPLGASKVDKRLTIWWMTKIAGEVYGNFLSVDEDELEQDGRIEELKAALMDNARGYIAQIHEYEREKRETNA